MIQLRRFTPQATKEFRALLTDWHERPAPAELLREMLTDVTRAELVVPTAEVPDQLASSRLDAATQLVQSLPADRSGLVRDFGVWSWLSGLYFDVICPPDSAGRRKLSAPYHYVFQDGLDYFDYRTSYRHRLWLTWRALTLTSANPSRLLLSGSLSTHGDVREQLASRQEFMTMPGLLEAADILYWDATRNRPKVGATDKVPGSIRRLAIVAGQLDLTMDLYQMSGRQVVDILPKEFNRWKA